jgi:hypothetical protein
MLGGPEQRVEPPQLDRALPLPQGPLARVERQPRLRAAGGGPVELVVRPPDVRAAVRPTAAPVSRRRLRVGLGPAVQRRADPVARAGRRGCGSARSAALQMSFACSLPSPDPWTCGGRWSPSEADWLRVRRRAPLRVAAAASKGVRVSLIAWEALPITETAIDAPIMVQM